MGASFPPSGKVALEFGDPAAFRRVFESEVSKGSCFIPCDDPPGEGRSVVLTFKVKNMGEVAFAGRVEGKRTTPRGITGALIRLDEHPAESHAEAKKLYERCLGTAPAPGTLGLGALLGEVAKPEPSTRKERAVALGEPTSAPPREEGAGALLGEGEVLDGRFRIERHLASGGMGDVYRATHVYMKRPVALKLLNRALANDPEMSSRFQREAELVSQIDSANVVRVLDFGRTSTGLLFLAMEFVEGVGLEKLLAKEGALLPERAVPLLCQVCEALAEAHDRGIVHRDLKPPNIMVSRRKDGSDLPKVLDFGIARLADSGQGQAGMTRAGMVLGTPEYISPEQALAGELDARTDIYALGVVAFEVLTGRLPFVAASLQKLVSMHVTQSPPALAEVRPELAAFTALSDVVLKAMAKEKDKRHSDMRAFALALKEALSQQGPALVSPTVVVRSSTPQPTASTCPQCGVAIEPDSAFCGQCGRSLRTGCPKCQAPVKAGAAFCGKCGAPQGSAGAAAPSPTPAPKRGASLDPASYARKGGLEEGPPPPAPAPKVEASSGRRRAVPRELADALEKLVPALTAERAEEALGVRSRGGVGPKQGIFVHAELSGAGHISDFTPDVEEASLVPRRCMARLVQAGVDHGGVFDWLELDVARFWFEGDELPPLAERAARAALAMREAIVEERLGLEKGCPLSVRLGVVSGSFEVPGSGAAALGEAVEAARSLSSLGAPGLALLDSAVAEAAGARVEVREPEDVPEGREVVQTKAPPVQGQVRLAGRERELGVLEGLLPLVATGEAKPLIVVAGPGLGKSRLAEEMAARARRAGLAVAFSRPGRGSKKVAYSALTSLLCDLCGVTERNRLDRLAPALESMKLPTAERVAALATAGVVPLPPQFTPGQAVFALRAVVANVAQARPVLLVFDDLDRADDQSVEAFRLLCVERQPRALPVAFARPEVLEGRELGVRPVPLKPLAKEGVDALVKELLGGQPPPDGLMEFLAERTGGNPRTMGDWVQLLFERGFLKPQASGYVLLGSPPPMDERALAAQRVEALGLSARRFFEAGCLLGEVFEAATVEAAVTEAKPNAAWTRLERSGLVRPLGGRRFAVSGQLYLEAGEARSSGHGRAMLHRRLAQALQGKVLELGATPPSAEIAQHLCEGRDFTSSLSWWQRASESAVNRRDPREAAARLRGWAAAVRGAGQAEALLPAQASTQEVELLSRASAQALVGGDAQLARQLMDEALKVEGAEAGAQAERALCHARLLRVEGGRDESKKALAWVATSRPSPQVTALAKVEKAEQADLGQDPAETKVAFLQALEDSAQAVTLAPWHGEIDLRARLEARLGALYLQQQDGKSALQSFGRALESWRRAKHPFAEARLLANLAALAAQSQKHADAARFFESAGEAAERAGDCLFRVRQLLNLAKVLKLSGDLAGSRQKARTAFELARQIAWPEGVKLAEALVQEPAKAPGGANP